MTTTTRQVSKKARIANLEEAIRAYEPIRRARAEVGERVGRLQQHCGTMDEDGQQIHWAPLWESVRDKLDGIEYRSADHEVLVSAAIGARRELDEAMDQLGLRLVRLGGRSYLHSSTWEDSIEEEHSAGDEEFLDLDRPATS